MQSPAKAREAALSDRIEQAICGAAELAKACEARFHASESRFEELSFATDAQVKQLVTDVEMQRAQDEKLLLAIDGAYHSMELLRSELHTQEAEMGRIKEELRLKEEATTRALAKADEERRAAEVGLHEQIRALTDHVSAMDRSAKAESATIRAEVAKQAASREAEAVAIRELIREAERNTKANSNAIRSELSRLADSHEAQMVAVKEQISATDRNAKHESDLVRAELKKHVADQAAELMALKEHAAAVGRGVKTESESVRSELMNQAASREAEVAAIRELISAAARDAKAEAEVTRSSLTKHAEGMQGLEERLFSWAREAISKGCAEEGRRLVEGMQHELRAEMSVLRTRVSEAACLSTAARDVAAEVAAAAPRWGMGASEMLSTMREAVWQLDKLGRLVARLSERVAQDACVTRLDEIAAEAQTLVEAFPPHWRDILLALPRPTSPSRSPSASPSRIQGWST